MRRIESEITVRGTPERVWSVLTDFARYPDWNPFIREASGEVKAGARLAVRFHPPGGRPMTFRPTVVTASPGRELRWLGHLGLPALFDGEHVFQLESAGAGGTRLRQSEEFRGVLVHLLPGSLYERTRRGFEAMNRALQAVVETASEFSIETEPALADVQYLEDRLYEFNSGATGIDDGAWLAIFVRDDAGRIVAGIHGSTWGGCFDIRLLWVEDTRRRQGLGTRLLEAAEREARRRGCTQAVLSTFDFQAPAFYRKHGFVDLAVTPEHPRGHQHLLLRKRLTDVGGLAMAPPSPPIPRAT